MKKIINKFNAIISIAVFCIALSGNLSAKECLKDRYNGAMDVINNLYSSIDKYRQLFKEKSSEYDALAANLGSIFPNKPANVEEMVQNLAALKEGLQNIPEISIVNQSETSDKPAVDSYKEKFNALEKVNHIVAQIEKCNSVMNSLEDVAGALETPQSCQGLHERMQTLVDNHLEVLKKNHELDKELCKISELLKKKESQLKKAARRYKLIDEKRKELEYYFNLLVTFLEENKD